MNNGSFIGGVQAGSNLVRGINQDIMVKDQYEQQKKQQAIGNARNEKIDGMNAEMHTAKMSNVKGQELRARVQDLYSVAGATGDPTALLDPSLTQELKANNMTHLVPTKFFAPKTIQNNLKLKTVLSAVRSGNPAAINEAPSLSAINEVYRDQIQKGVGIEGKNGKVIAAKKLSRFEVGPKGGVIPMVEVVTEGGETYEAPMTLGRGTGEDDMVSVRDPKRLLDDAMGRYMTAEAMSSPGAMENIRRIQQALFPSQAKDTRTNDQKLYDQARQQGYTGSIVDFIRGNKKSGATNVSLTNNSIQEDEFSKKMGAHLAEAYSGILKSSRAAQGELGTLDRMEQALSNPAVYQGTAAEAVNGIKRMAESIGFDMEGVSDAEVIQSLGNKMALALRNPDSGMGMPGAMSDKDREFLVSSVPGLSKTPEGNLKLIGYMRKVAERKIMIAKMARAYRKDNSVLNEGFYDELESYSEANPMFANEQAEPISSPSSTDRLGLNINNGVAQPLMDDGPNMVKPINDNLESEIKSEFPDAYMKDGQWVVERNGRIMGISQ